MRLTPLQADCGTTMGLDYLKDNRTATRVALGILVTQESLTVTANVQGDYRPGAVDQNITLSCVSRGQLEESAIDGILARLKAP